MEAPAQLGSGRRGLSTSWRGDLVVVAVVAVVTACGYLALLGWGHEKTLGADGDLHGPYEPWQVIALVAVLGVLAVWTGWRGRFGLGTVVATFVLTLLWSIDAATGSGGDGLWPVGAGMVFAGTAGGFVVVSALAKHVRATRRARRVRY
jgi:hypothetical protein